MSQINVQFSDDKETDVIAYFCSCQPELVNAGVVESNDARYFAFYNAMPNAVQQSMPTPD